MRKVILIGRFNTILHEINDELIQYFSVQMCVNNPDMVKGMLKLNKPNLVILSLNGLDMEGKQILGELKTKYAYTPVICIGTKAEQSDFSAYINTTQFKVLTRPLSNDLVVKAACELLGVTYEGSKQDVLQILDDLQEPEDEIPPVIMPKVQEAKSDRKSVLLVDDDKVMLRTLSSALSERYDVRVANSGMSALTLIGKSVPDIIFLDYEMPMCDGKMTMQMMREVDEAKDIPIIFLTGYRDAEHIKEVIGLKPAGYLVKPPNLDTIFQTIENVLAKKKK